MIRHVVQTKVDVNLALDAAAGRVLTVDERRAWWIEDARYLRMLDPEEYDALVDEARTKPVNTNGSLR